MKIHILTAALLASAASGESPGQCEPFERLAPQGEILPQFTPAVALDGDLAAFAGGTRVFVYERQAGAWSHDTTIQIEGVQSVDFIWSLALAGDVLVIGGGYNEIVLVYRRVDGQWSLEGSLVPWDGSGHRWFGVSVDAEQDVIVVGAHADDDAEPGNLFCSSGSAYVFRFDGTSWTAEAKLTASDGACLHEFGASVSIAGDVVLVGAPGAGLDGAGAAYVFRRADGQWCEEAILTTTAGTADWGLGYAAATDGNTVVAKAKTFGGPHALHAAYVFEDASGEWQHEATFLMRSDELGLYSFRSVAVEGNTLIVGAYDMISPYRDAFLFRRVDGTWRPTATLTLPDGSSDFYLGFSMDLSDSTALLGAQWVPAPPDGLSSISAHLFDVESCSPCLGDIDGNGNVGVADVLTLWAAWGTNPDGPPDLDWDGTVGAVDFVLLVANWGPCP